MRQHLVQMYQDSGFLIDRVVDFLEEGVAAGETPLVIARPPHAHAIQDRVAGTAVHDAQGTLDLFMRNDMPDPRLFRQHVGGLMESAARAGNGSVRGFGEMVAILWEEGKHEAAIRLEHLWNELPHAEQHSLICAYRVTSFAAAKHTDGFLAICNGHSQVFPSEAAHTEPDLGRRMAALEQKAAALQAEVSRRLKVEAELAYTSQRKDDFIAMLAHELRNPLTPICAATAMLGGPVSPEQHKRLVDTIERQAGVLRRLVEDLLDARRVASGHIELRKAPVDLAQVAKQAGEAVAPQLRERGHSLQMVTAEAWIDGDAVRLLQAATNLLINAAKFTPHAGKISVHVEVEGEWARLRVRDNGRGMDPNFIARAFEPYAQAPDSVGEGGLGLGLAVARSIAELHGGRIEATSEGRGKGSTFEIVLPHAAVAHIGSPGRSANRGGASVLVVDDNADIRDTLADLLRAYGHQATTAASGQEALLAAAARPDVVLLDLSMPGMDGFETARRLRAIDPDVTLVALSGHAQAGHFEAARVAGFDHQMAKPPDVDALLSLLSSRSEVLK